MKLKTTVTVLVLVMFMVPAVAASADFTPGRWWRVPKLAEQVKLTDQDKRQLDKVFQENRKKLRDLKDKVEDEQIALEDIICADPLNETAVMNQFRKLDRVRSELADAYMRYFIETRKIIGAERFKTVSEIAKMARQNRRAADPAEKE